jgi:hypothetical protein
MCLSRAELLVVSIEWCITAINLEKLEKPQ